MTPLIFATALSILAPAVSGVSVHGHHAIKFDDTRMDIIGNGGDPNEVLCADRPIVGSRFIRHICYTRSQWAQLKSVQQRATGQMISHLNEGSTLGGGLGDPSRPPGADNPP
jgi:hypothetical protein